MTFAISRFFWVAATIFNVILGAIGAVLPIMPGTPFFILAFFCLKKASPELHQRIVHTKLMVWLETKFPLLEHWLN